MGKTTMRHIHMSVENLLSMDDSELIETVTHPDGVEAARVELQSMLNDGVTCLVVDQSCDNKRDDGSCGGHPIEEKKTPEARTEQRNYAVAYCPHCDAEHDVSTCGEGEETCLCGTTFIWSTVD